MKKVLFSIHIYGLDLALLLLRGAVSIMMLRHGWTKIADFSENLNQFADPLGLGVATSLQMAIFSEFFCSILVALGFMTRWALIPLIITLSIVVFVVHGEDSFGSKELPLMYLVTFVFLLFSGPGKFSMDHQILKSNRY